VTHVVTLTVAGVPAPQGSKVRTRWGVREDNEATRPWRSAVAHEATVVMNGDTELLFGPLRLEVAFYFPRPKSHFGSGAKANTLKDSAPRFHTSKPDTDKLLRAIGDSLTGIVVRDDSHLRSCTPRSTTAHPRR
jgi:crossover junction endodeoxyribonuclease RusA